MWEQESQREGGFIQLWTLKDLTVSKYPENQA